MFERGAGVDIFDCNVVLFQSEDDEEGLLVECTVTPDGGLAVLQESAGPLTAWCFDESPHRIELHAGPDAVAGLLEHFRLEGAWQLPFALRFECPGYDSCLRVRDLLKGLGLAYRVVEAPVVR